MLQATRGRPGADTCAARCVSGLHGGARRGPSLHLRQRAPGARARAAGARRRSAGMAARCSGASASKPTCPTSSARCRATRRWSEHHYPADAPLGRRSGSRGALRRRPHAARRQAQLLRVRRRHHRAQAGAGGAHRGQGRGRARQPRQVALHVDDVARAAHADECDPRLQPAADVGHRAPADRRAAALRARDPARRAPPAAPDQRRARSRPHRVGPAGDGDGSGAAAAVAGRVPGADGAARAGAAGAAAAGRPRRARLLRARRPAAPEAGAAQPAGQRHQVQPPRRPGHRAGLGERRTRRRCGWSTPASA